MSDTVKILAGEPSRAIARDPAFDDERRAESVEVLCGRSEPFRPDVASQAASSVPARFGPELWAEGNVDWSFLGSMIEVFSPGSGVALDTLAPVVEHCAFAPDWADVEIETQANDTVHPPPVAIERLASRDAGIPFSKEPEPQCAENYDVQDVVLQAEPAARGDQEVVPPARSCDLVLSHMEPGGHCVVKDLRTGSYYNAGEREAFLLSSLDGQQNSRTIRGDFEARFGEALTEEDLDAFLDLARSLGWLRTPGEPEAGDEESPSGVARGRADSGRPRAPAANSNCAPSNVSSSARRSPGSFARSPAIKAITSPPASLSRCWKSPI